jgi:c-di-GMP-related signal transduction protein
VPSALSRKGDIFLQRFLARQPILNSKLEMYAYELLYVKLVCECIKAEVSLSLRLLRYLNSPVFPLATEVRSIPHAVSLLGESGTRKWVSVVTIACMSGGKPRELVMLPLIRARFCELLDPVAGRPAAASDLFLLGLLSAHGCVSGYGPRRRAEGNQAARGNPRGAARRPECAAGGF